MIDHGVRRVILEKPLAANRRELSIVSDLMRSSEIELYIQEQYLYSRLLEELVALVADPDAYVRRRGLSTPVPLRIEETHTVFSKDRIDDAILGRHTANICLLELPHVLTILHHAFGSLSCKRATITDLHLRSTILSSYRNASIVMADGGGVRHRITLSNVDRYRRLLKVRLSEGYAVELHFPGMLRHRNTVFSSQVTILRNDEAIDQRILPDDHLATAVASYLDWDDLRGTYENCYEPSRLVVEIVEGQT
ncbi:MAG: hypothetical protein AAF481_17285 [Acidobacteriota bacterium]